MLLKLQQLMYYMHFQTNKQTTNSMALVREWIIPTERPPLVGEVSAKSFIHLQNILKIVLHVYIYIYICVCVLECVWMPSIEQFDDFSKEQ
jgi:hypothetical protein